jgi:tetratricopeptide (TPR) repeat protein
MRKARRLVPSAGALLLSSLFFSGCLATRQEIEDLRVDISQLQNALSKAQSNQSTAQSALQGSQADTLAQMHSLTRQLEILSAHLEESQNHMSLLSSRMDDLDQNLSHRLDSLSETLSGAKPGAPAAPSALFNQAYGDFTRRRYDVALKFYIGESHFAKSDWPRALEAYDKVLKDHPNSAIVPAAYLQKGAALEKRGQTNEALAVYDAIARKYPHRKEAQAARDRMSALKGGAPSDPREPAER